ncbi:MAG TPA: sialidase family protein, partial [Bryobacteraceae bacterium]
MRRYLSLPAALLFVFAARSASFTQTELFRAGEGGYYTYRVPSLIVTAKGTLLAFCEGRRNSGSDAGDIDVLLRRSFDRGKTWSAVQTVADKGEDTVGNPTPVVERTSGTIFLLLTSNPGWASERQITER